MPSLPSSVDSDWHTSDSLWDWFFLALLAALLAFLPFSLGAVEAWSELVVVCAAVLLAIGLLLRDWFDPDFRLGRSWTYLPLLGILVLIVVQLVPLPARMVGAISPRAVELREELLGKGSLGELAPAADAQATLSLCPYETSHDLRMAIVFAVLFVVTASVFRSSSQIKRALLLLLVIGCVEAGIGLLQILTLSTKIHWLYAERGQVVTSGSFINYSHFCQFLNLAMGAGVALLLVRMSEGSDPDRDSTGWLPDLRSEQYLRLFAGIVLCAVAVCASMSRNGVISLLVASGVVGLLLYRRGVLSARGWLIGMAPWCVLLILFFTCFDMLYNRLATFEDHQHLEDRLEMTVGTLRAWSDFPVLGAGLGTHEYVFPLYDKTVSTSMAEHADNDWAQLLEEFGLLGAGAVLLFVLGIFGVAGKLIFFGRTALSTAAFGLSLGLLATAWHSLSDFGQHLPGVFSVTAVIAGLVVAIARREFSEEFSETNEELVEEPDPGFRSASRYLIGVFAAVSLLGISWWMVSGAMAASRGEAWANVALGYEQRLQRGEGQGSDQDYRDLLMAAQLAAEAEPTNAKQGYLLNLHRWRSISRARDPETGSIHLDPSVLPFVSQIADEVALVRTHCPTYGPPCSLEGELRLLVLGEPAGSQLIYQAARLTPYHAATTYLAGQLAAREGRLDEAIALLKRTVSLDPRQFSAVSGVYLGELRRPDLAVELAGDSYDRMLRLAQLLETQLLEIQQPNAVEPATEQTSKEYSELALELRASALVRLRELALAGKATAGKIAKLAAVEMREDHPKLAIDLYRKALAKQYGQIHWRLALSRALLKVGESEQALREAKIVLRLQPQSLPARKLIEDISVLPAETLP